MWPFTSNNKDEDDVVSSNLPDSLKQFYKEVNPKPKHESIFEISPHHQRVSEVLQKQKGTYSYEFDKYKGAETPRKVVSINCAEMQQKVVECLRGWTLTATSYCEKEVQNNKVCMEIQKKALKSLFYGDCVNKEQCEKIRAAVDYFYTKNFGRYGENINEENQKSFDKDLDKAFYTIWT